MGLPGHRGYWPLTSGNRPTADTGIRAKSGEQREPIAAWIGVPSQIERSVSE